MRRSIIFAFVVLAAFVRKLIMRGDVAYKLLFTPGADNFRTKIGLWKAWYVFEKARRECPAYSEFLRANGFTRIRLNGWTPDLSTIPPMDKANFIRVYSMASRCYGGKLPVRGAVIDQSSGSTGKPTSWVRGPDERKAVARIMQLALREHVGNKQILFVNAFALGPWATGMSVSYSISDECLLISVGPDVDKIVGVLEDFGSEDFIYVIAGYPPFLKMLVDSGRIDWSQYDSIAFYGGEGMSEGMRSYLLEAFSEVYGDYGASDLEINIAAENAFTVEVRRLMVANESLRRRINSRLSTLPGLERLQDALPHIFQYNQLDYVVETNDQGELLITVGRASNVSPRVRYNIHDNGFVMSHRELAALLAAEGVDVDKLPPAIADLPVMLHYGRSDLAASYYGCKIPPTDVEKIVFEIPELARIYNSFRMITAEDEEHNKHLTIAIELVDGMEAPTAEGIDALTQQVFELLGKHNQDYRESARIAAQKGVYAKLEFFGFRQGPFVNSDIRLKNRYTEEKK